MKRILMVVLAVFICLAMVPASYAIRNTANLDRQQGGVVVKNEKGSDIGTIGKVLEDSKGDIAFVIITLNREMNGKKEVIVPVGVLSESSQDGVFIVAMSDDALASAPAYEASKLEDPGYAGDLYRYYGQTPPWSE